MPNETIKSFDSKDGKRSVEFDRSSTGTYSFTEYKWWPHASEEARKALEEDGYWTLARTSGLYETLEECMRDAVGILPWFEGPQS